MKYFLFSFFLLLAFPLGVLAVLMYFAFRVFTFPFELVYKFYNRSFDSFDRLFRRKKDKVSKGGFKDYMSDLKVASIGKV